MGRDRGNIKYTLWCDLANPACFIYIERKGVFLLSFDYVGLARGDNYFINSNVVIPE
jgi:hypothetical protein